tara:strand:- start:1161 stop:1598 length:438 start_codon:yes stop_codon:yes gene_type:complete
MKHYPITTHLRNKLRDKIVVLRIYLLKAIYKMSIGDNTVISIRAVLDKTNPKGIHIGEYSYIAYGAIVLTHDFINSKHMDTYIGNNVFIGAYSVVMPGVVIEDNVIVAAGSIVTRNIKSGAIVAGNPAQIIKNNVSITKYGKKAL